MGAVHGRRNWRAERPCCGACLAAEQMVALPRVQLKSACLGSVRSGRPGRKRRVGEAR